MSVLSGAQPLRLSCWLLYHGAELPPDLNSPGRLEKNTNKPDELNDTDQICDSTDARLDLCTSASDTHTHTH